MNKNGRIKYILSYIAFALIFAAAVILFIFAANTFFPDTDDAGKVNPDVSEISKPVVVIDAGHGGEDGGASGKNGALEKDLNLSIALELCDMLRANGIEVVMTRTEDILLYDRNVNYKGRKKALDLARRVEIGNETENCVFVSIHMNSFPINKYSGLQVYYSKNAEQSRALADSIQKFAKKYLQPDNDRETKPASSNIYILHHIQNPAVLVECGFLSNPDECEKLCNAEYRREISFVLCAAILEFLHGGA